MHSIQVYLDESLSGNALEEVKTALLTMPFVENVVINENDNHELMVDYDEHQGVPMDILDTISSKGLHPDIISG